MKGGVFLQRHADATLYDVDARHGVEKNFAPLECRGIAFAESVAPAFRDRFDFIYGYRHICRPFFQM